MLIVKYKSLLLNVIMLSVDMLNVVMLSCRVMTFHNKLGCLSLASLSGLDNWLWVTPGAYPLKGASFAQAPV
jgi:hypothetical protein